MSTFFPPFFTKDTMNFGFRLVILWFALGINAETVEIVTPENSRPENVTPSAPSPSDSYLRAYEEVQKLRSAPSKRNDYEDSYNTVIRSSYLHDDRYPSLTQYWTPSGPPAPHFQSSPPDCPTRPTPYSSPSTSFFALLPKKLSLKLLLKVLLKLVLFKMIVKLIAVICLLLFIPVLKTKGGETGGGGGSGDEDSRELDDMADYIWNGIEDSNTRYGEEEEEEVEEIKDVAEELDDDGERDNVFSGPIRAVRFLEFCVSVVDRVVGYMLTVLKRQNNETDDLSSFFLEKFENFVKNV